MNSIDKLFVKYHKKTIGILTLTPDGRRCVFRYDNGEIIIHWDSDLCTHAGVCWHMLPKVFRPSERPWVRPENDPSALSAQTINGIFEKIALGFEFMLKICLFLPR